MSWRNQPLIIILSQFLLLYINIANIIVLLAYHRRYYFLIIIEIY